MKPKSCFPNLLAEIARRGLTISGMAAELGRARDTLSRNFNGSLRIDEALRIRDRYFRIAVSIISSKETEPA